ncbi:hypothetical protein V8D89_000917 [Ganoderma adspersum]
MIHVRRQGRWNTYGYTNPWAAHFTSGDARESFFSEHFATESTQTSQEPTSTSVSTTATATVVPVAAAKTSDSPTQAPTNTEPVAVETKTAITTSLTLFPLSLSGGSTSRSTSSHEAAHSSGGSAPSVLIPMSSGGLTVSLPDSGTAAQPTASDAISTTQPTASESSSTAQSVATGSGTNSNSSQVARRMGNGEIAAIALGLVFALGLGVLAYFLCKRRAARRRDSTFIQYPFSSDAATGRMSEVPHGGALVPLNTPAEWDTRTDGAKSLSATLTFGSPTGASGYGGGRAVYPLDEKSPSPSPSPFHDTVDPATTPSPRSTTAFALSFPMPPSPSPLSRPSPSASSEHSSPVAPPPPAHTPLPSGEGEPSALPYTWDHPPPSSEYLPPRTPDRRSTFRASRGALGPGPSPRRASFGTVAATPIYSSGVPSVDRRPPSYSRY